MRVMQNMDNLMKPIPSEIKILYDAFLVKKANSFCILLYPQDRVIIVKNKDFMRFDSSLFSARTKTRKFFQIQGRRKF